jgi:hypothetical protein
MNKSPPGFRAIFTKYIRVAQTGRRAEANLLLDQLKAKLKEPKTMLPDTTTENGKKLRKTKTTPGGGETIPLTPEQLQKLWQIIVGGRLVIDTDADGFTICHVSLESFSRALPTLLERL